MQQQQQRAWLYNAEQRLHRVLAQRKEAAREQEMLDRQRKLAADMRCVFSPPRDWAAQDAHVLRRFALMRVLVRLVWSRAADWYRVAAVCALRMGRGALAFSCCTENQSGRGGLCVRYVAVHDAPRLFALDGQNETLEARRDAVYLQIYPVHDAFCATFVVRNDADTEPLDAARTLARTMIVARNLPTPTDDCYRNEVLDARYGLKLPAALRNVPPRDAAQLTRYVTQFVQRELACRSARLGP